MIQRPAAHDDEHMALEERPACYACMSLDGNMTDDELVWVFDLELLV